MAVAIVLKKEGHPPKGVKIPIPEGFDLDGKEPGDEISVLLKAKIGKGFLIPISLDGTPSEGHPEPDGDEDENGNEPADNPDEAGAPTTSSEDGGIQGMVNRLIK